MLEKQLQTNIIGWLNRHNIPNHKNHGGSVYAFRNGVNQRYSLKSGMPDLEIFYQGKVIFLELKSDVGKVSQSQKEMFTKLKEQGFEKYIFVVKPNNWKEFILEYKKTKDVYQSLVNAIGFYKW